MFKTFRLIYKSIPFGYDQNILNGILSDAINYNKKNNITGALVCRDDIYLQLLEGPRVNHFIIGFIFVSKLLHTMDKINRLDDDRHINLYLLKNSY